MRLVVEAEAAKQVVRQVRPDRDWLVLATPVPSQSANQSTHLDREFDHRAACREGQVLVCSKRECV